MIEKKLQMAIQGVLGMIIFFLLGSMELNIKTMIMIVCLSGIIGLSWFNEVKK